MNKIINKFKIKDIASYQYFYLIIITLFCRLITFNFDNDFWFTINEGRYVLNNGFPTKAINSLHNIDFLYQSWGTGTLFYSIYHNLGYIGIIILLIIIGLLTAYFFYKLCLLVSNNKKISLRITLITMFFYFGYYLVTRPHIFTVLNLIIMFYLLEKYIKTLNIKYLYLLPFITLLEVNMHGIYYIVLLIIITPYLINSFKFNIFGIKSKGYPKKHLFISYILMIITGFINPYGYKTIIYGFKSYKSNSLFNNTINELLSPDFHTLYGKIIIISILIIMVIYFRDKKKNIPLRYYLLLIGTCYLALDATKSFYLFLIASLFPISYIFKDKKNNIDNYSKLYHYGHLLLTCLVIISIICLIKEPEYPSSYNMLNYLDSIKEDKENIKLFTNYYDGSYAEYRGYNCYLDPRGEIFLKQNSNNEDIYLEYDYVDKSIINYQDFLNKYMFDYILLSKKDNLYYQINNYGHDNYIVIMEDDNYQLLSLITN